MYLDTRLFELQTNRTAYQSISALYYNMYIVHKWWRLVITMDIVWRQHMFVFKSVLYHVFVHNMHMHVTSGYKEYWGLTWVDYLVMSAQLHSFAQIYVMSQQCQWCLRIVWLNIKQLTHRHCSSVLRLLIWTSTVIPGISHFTQAQWQVAQLCTVSVGFICLPYASAHSSTSTCSLCW